MASVWKTWRGAGRAGAAPPVQLMGLCDAVRVARGELVPERSAAGADTKALFAFGHDEADGGADSEDGATGTKAMGARGGPLSDGGRGAGHCALFNLFNSNINSIQLLIPISICDDSLLISRGKSSKYISSNMPSLCIFSCQRPSTI